MKNVLLIILFFSFEIFHSQIWGVNGHPITQETYINFGIDNQFNLIHNNFNLYRFDLVFFENGEVYNADLYNDFLIKSKYQFTSCTCFGKF